MQVEQKNIWEDVTRNVKRDNSNRAIAAYQANMPDAGAVAAFGGQEAYVQQMQTNSLRSRYSIYNDKEMTSQYTSYTKTIAEWETKISDKEDYYYKKFSKMETALSKLNSQTSSLSGMFSS